MVSVRLLLSLAARNGWKVYHLDVKTAFLYGELKEKVFVRQPDGFPIKGQENKVYRLNKSLYGLKQAPRAWNTKLHQTLLKLGFKRCKMEHAMYKRGSKRGTLLLGVYVDDLIVTGSSLDEITCFKEQMKGEFQMTDLGLLTYYLGLEVQQNDEGISLKQSGYATKLLKEENMWDAHPNQFPMDPGLKLSKSEGGNLVDATKYRRIVGCLRYLTHTRPDLSFAIGIVSRYLDAPKVAHLQAVKQILRFLRGTVDHGIKYTRNGDPTLIGYSDSSHATDRDDGKSTTGMVFYHGGGPIAWASQKQKTVALSSCEAEFMAATAAACQAIWLKRLLEELTDKKMEAIILKVDNKSAIELMKNPVFHGRSKHIDTRYHFIRECVEDELVKVEYVNGSEQKADVLTKALPRLKYGDMRKMLGMVNFGVDNQN